MDSLIWQFANVKTEPQDETCTEKSGIESEVIVLRKGRFACPKLLKFNDVFVEIISVERIWWNIHTTTYEILSNVLYNSTTLLKLETGHFNPFGPNTWLGIAVV